LTEPDDISEKEERAMVISSRCPVQYEEELQSEEESSVAFTANASGQGGWLMVSV
jgi:hypothetical protein